MAERPVVVVTGASSGIGEAAARWLVHKREARVVLVARREERLRELGASFGHGASYVAADVTDDGAPAAVRDHVESRLGRLDVLVNNAGARFTGGTLEDLRRTMEVNLFAPVRLTGELLPLLRSAGGGSVVNVASVAARVARPSTGAYSASKAALIAWSDALRAEEGSEGVHVGTVLPGFIKTEGFPARELLARRATAWIVSDVDRVAAAIEAVAFDGVAERVAPRGYAAFGLLRVVAPRLVFRLLGGRGSSAFATSPGAGSADQL
jgi:short-subunit dehydrogenase